MRCSGRYASNASVQISDTEFTSVQNRAPYLAPPTPSKLSPHNKPALGRQRDHSFCRQPQTPLQIRKTRENLSHINIYADIPPPCVHEISCSQDESFVDCGEQTKGLDEDVQSIACTDKLDYNGSKGSEKARHLRTAAHPQSSTSKMVRQKSVSRRMLSMVKHGIRNRSQASRHFAPTDSDPRAFNPLVGSQESSLEQERRAQSFELSRYSFDGPDEDLRCSIQPGRPFASQFHSSSTVSTEVLSNALIGSPLTQTSPELKGALLIDDATITNSPLDLTPSLAQEATSRPPSQARPPETGYSDRTVTLSVPCVALDVQCDSTAVDVGILRDVWIAIHAKVSHQTTVLQSRSQFATTAPAPTALTGAGYPQAALRGHDSQSHCGVITSLRLCFKPVAGCYVRDFVGRKSAKNLDVGQECELFLRLHVPAIEARNDRLHTDQDSLFAELESLIGTLETEILHVEAKYRHSLLPTNNVVTVRDSVKIRRPDGKSRWSLIGFSEDEEAVVASQSLHMRLAQCIASRRPPGLAMKMLQEYIQPDFQCLPAIRQIVEDVERRLKSEHLFDKIGPCVIVTSIDPSTSSMPSCMLEKESPEASSEIQSLKLDTSANSILKSTSPPNRPPALAVPLISAPKTTTALTIENNPSPPRASAPLPASATELQDSARQLWRHIRRTSLSTNQLGEMTLEHVQHLEAEDEHIRDLRRKALANKRSVGAETLKAWKWEESKQKESLFRPAEAPWM